MERKSFKAPREVLVFGSTHELLGRARSLHAAADMMACNLQAVSFCCTGKYVQSCGYYFRHLNPEAVAGIEDLYSLTLEEYDRLCGEERVYYPKDVMEGKRRRVIGRRGRKTGRQNKG